MVTRAGQVAATATIYPHEPQRRWDESIAQLARLAGEHRVELMAIGNGTASRETDRLGAELIRRHPEIELTRWWFQRLAPQSTPPSAGEPVRNAKVEIWQACSAAIWIGSRIASPANVPETSSVASPSMLPLPHCPAAEP